MNVWGAEVSNTIRYEPAVHCVVDINLGKQVAATRRVLCRDGRDYRVCDLHAELVESCPSIMDAMREIRRQRAIGGAA